MIGSPKILMIKVSNPSETEKIARSYSFLKWLKLNYKAYYILYATHFTIRGNDLKITISLDYISPEDKEEVQKIVNEFNFIAGD